MTTEEKTIKNLINENQDLKAMIRKLSEIIIKMKEENK